MRIALIFVLFIINYFTVAKWQTCYMDHIREWSEGFGTYKWNMFTNAQHYSMVYNKESTRKLLRISWEKALATTQLLQEQEDIDAIFLWQADVQKMTNQLL